MMPRNLFIAAAVLLSLAVLYYLSRNGDDELNYTIEPVTRGNIESVVVTTGTLEALNTIVVGSQLSGQIAALHADFNDQVTEGQLIARLDPRTFEARVRQARADVKVGEANVVQREAEVVRAKSTLSQAERDLARRQSLKEKGHVSESELDADLTAFETAQANLKVAEAAVINARAQLEQRQAGLNQAEVDLERTYIRSPVDGTVINRTVEIGQTVAASLQAPELFSIAQDLHQMKVEASVDEADIGRISENMPVRFSVDAYPDREFEGGVQQIRIAPDKVQNVVTYRVIIAAANEDLSLLPGMTANVQVILGTRDNVLRVANSALRFKPRGLALQGAHESDEDAVLLHTRINKELVLDPDARSQLDALMAEHQKKMAVLQGGRFGPRNNALKKEQTRQRTYSQIKAMLDPDQRRRFDYFVTQIELGGGGLARVWLLEGDEFPVSRTVTIGLADDEVTEIVEGLEEGDEVIIRAIRKRT